VLPKVWTQRFQSLRLHLPKAEFKRLQTDMDNFIKREIQKKMSPPPRVPAVLTNDGRFSLSFGMFGCSICCTAWRC
jgi:hypothetical protein